MGRGWFYGAFPGGLPHRRLLDEAVPDRPAFMTGYDGHTGWANSRALQAAGITRDTPDPEGGAIVQGRGGRAHRRPEGDGAARWCAGSCPEPTDEERYQALRQRLARGRVLRADLGAERVLPVPRSSRSTSGSSPKAG